MKLIKVKKQDDSWDDWSGVPEKYRNPGNYWNTVQSYPSGVRVEVYSFIDENRPNHVAVYTPTSNKMRYRATEPPETMQKVAVFFEPILKDLKKAIPLAKKIEREIIQYNAKIKNV